jgi:hypothetical protein
MFLPFPMLFPAQCVSKFPVTGFQQEFVPVERHSRILAKPSDIFLTSELLNLRPFPLSQAS